MNTPLLVCLAALAVARALTFTVQRSSADIGSYKDFTLPLEGSKRVAKVYAVTFLYPNFVRGSRVYDVDDGELRRDIPEINAASGKRLIEGDIAFPPEKNAITDRSKRWKFPIPYILADNLDLNAKGVILQGIEMFRLKSCVDFKQYGGEKTFIKFEKLDGCWSYVGDLQRGQSLSIGERCDTKSIVEHELLHALGFYHEHSRTDRDDYVHIWWDEIIEGYEYAFDRYNDDFIYDLNTPYDYESVMHYGPLSFNKNPNVATIGTKIPAFNDVIGQRLDFSKIDLERLNRMYNCTSTITMLDQCAFELANICGMVKNVRDGAEWTRKMSIPGEEDHTLVGGCRDEGYFMHMDTRTGREGESALLESRILYPQRSQKCLQFFYKMNGSPQDQVTIWIRKDDGTGNVRRISKLQTIKGDGTNQWKLAHIPFHMQTKFRYVFQGVKGDSNNSTGGIYIDDVSLMETNCPANVWHISNFSSLLKTTVKGDVLLSPVYYNAEGYSYGLKLYPHGMSSSPYNSYVAIYFHLCSSENEGILEWPAGNRQVMLTILDQDPNAINRMSLSRSFTTNASDLVAGRNDTFTWDKPAITGTYDPDCKCFRGAEKGWTTFVSHSEIRRKNFLKNDDLFFFADFEDLTHLIKTEVKTYS